ncbi:hypothetical protein [Haloarcula montana]|uniref:hypothetical protein n=1 Tax=Haloarcula montana TaxID=3111776 RepID=UPI002D776A31|nr:hypothetical protein [Haloarcula sp. GH36]
MPLSTSEYLSRKGTIEVLCAISPSGSQFEELVTEVSISRPTVSQRLTEGQEVSLLHRKAVTRPNGTTHLHALTPRGATIRVRLFEQGTVLSYRQYNQARKEFNKSISEFHNSVDEHPPDLSDERANEQNLKTILQRDNISVDNEQADVETEEDDSEQEDDADNSEE